MWRAFFMAIGISLILLGIECLVVDQAILASPTDALAPYTLDAPSLAGKVIQPPEWAPWSFLSGGAIILLYAISLKGGGGG